MPKLKLGAAVYALLAIGWLVSAGAVFRGYGSYAVADRWYQLAISAVYLLTGVLFGIGAVTRRGLLSDDGPRICRQGWILGVALAGAGLVVSFMGEADWGAPYPTIPALFMPPWIKRLQEKYYEGIEEAERELNPAEPGEVRPPTV